MAELTKLEYERLARETDSRLAEQVVIGWEVVCPVLRGGQCAIERRFVTEKPTEIGSAEEVQTVYRCICGAVYNCTPASHAFVHWAKDLEEAVKRFLQKKASFADLREAVS